MGVVTKFVPANHITEESFIAINGRPGSGKTTLAIDLTYHINASGLCDGILLVTESLKTIKLLQPHIPALSFVHVVNRRDPNSGLPNQMQWVNAETFINSWLDMCRARHDRYVREGKVPKRYLLILDDCGFDRARLGSKMMLRIYNNFRQVGVIPMIICQELYQLHKEGRQNVTHCFSFRLLSDKQHKDMWQAYFGIMDFKTFKAVMHKATAPPRQFVEQLERRNLRPEEMVEAKRRGPRGCIVYDGWRAANAETWNDCVFFYYPSYALCKSDWLFGNPLYFSLSKKWMPDPLAEMTSTIQMPQGDADLAVSDVGNLTRGGAAPPSTVLLGGAE